MGDLDAALGADARPRRSWTRPSATGSRAAGSTAATCSRSTRRPARRSRARRTGGGPTLIEAVTYRAAPHATADDPSAYIDLERVEEEKKNECVGRYEGYLERLGLLTDAEAEQVRAEAADVLRTGIAEAEAEPPGDASLLFEHAHVDPLPSFVELTELRRASGG